MPTPFPDRHARTRPITVIPEPSPITVIPEPSPITVIPEWGYRESILTLPTVAWTPKPTWIPAKGMRE